MSEPEVLSATADKVAVITLNRPDRLNALTPSMGENYVQAMRDADADPDVRVIVVTGAGRGFCSGADLSILSQGSDALNGFVQGQTWDHSPAVALSLRTPVAMAINGAAAGVGMVIALSGDVRFASPQARLISVFSQIGLVAEYGLAWLLPRMVGQGRASEILLSGRSVDSEEAVRIGMVHEISDDPLAAAMTWARTVAASCSPTSTALIKQQLMSAATSTLPEAFDLSLREMSASFARPDLVEAQRARAEKRLPNFPPRV